MDHDRDPELLRLFQNGIAQVLSLVWKIGVKVGMQLYHLKSVLFHQIAHLIAAGGNTLVRVKHHSPDEAIRVGPDTVDHVLVLLTEAKVRNNRNSRRGLDDRLGY